MPPPTLMAAGFTTGFSQGAVQPVVSKLEAFTRLSSEDRAALAQLNRNSRVIDARRDLISEGDRPRHVHLVLEGWACRYKQLPTASARSSPCSSPATSAT